jgi:hypothetical protein
VLRTWDKSATSQLTGQQQWPRIRSDLRNYREQLLRLDPRQPGAATALDSVEDSLATILAALGGFGMNGNGARATELSSADRHRALLRFVVWLESLA